MFLSVEDIKTLKSDKFISKDDFIKDFDVYPERGDVLMTRIGDIGTSNVVGTDEALAYYVSLALIKPFDIASYYLNYLISSNLFREELNNRTLSTAIPKKINMGEIGKINFYIPIINEQLQIGEFFKNLDEKLELEKEKQKKLINYKKTMLEDMFPKEGEKVPKVRFDGFDDEWEDIYLEKLGTVISGNGFPVEEQGGVFGTPYIKVSDMNGFGNDIFINKTNNYVTRNQIIKNEWKEISGPSIVFAKVGAAVFLDRKRIVMESFLIDNNMMSFIPADGDNIYFLKLIFDNIKLANLVQTGALPSLSSKDIYSIKISIPSPEEQTLIGNFFKNLDEKIELSEKKIVKIENFKKAMLEKMFV